MLSLLCCMNNITRKSRFGSGSFRGTHTGGRRASRLRLFPTSMMNKIRLDSPLLRVFRVIAATCP